MKLFANRFKIKLLGSIFGLIVCFTFFSTSCSQSDKPNSRFTSVPPAALQALGIPLSAYVILSIDSKHHPLTLDPQTNSFKGDIIVPTGSTFDLTVIYEAEDSISEQMIEIAHYVRRNLVAIGDRMEVAYEGEEEHWETLFDLSTGTINSLNNDGDAYNNFVEIGYRSDPLSASSLPLGPEASASHPDPIFGNQNASLPPPGADVTASLKGEEEITLTAQTPFRLSQMEVVSPSYGYTVLSEDLARGVKVIRLDTRRFAAGSSGRTMTLTVRVTDEYQIARDTTFTFAAYNPTDDLPPYAFQLGLNEGQTITDRINFVWELEDPSGVDPLSALIQIIRTEWNINESLFPADSNTSENRFRSQVTIETTHLPEGAYPITFSARDSLGNVYTETRNIFVSNTAKVFPFQCGDGSRGIGEECDDSNTLDNDGCSSSCRIEPAEISLETPVEGEVVRDIISIRGSAISLAGENLTFFGITNRPDINDTDGNTGIFVGSWDVRRMQEDQSANLAFLARDQDNRTALVTRTVYVDNYPNISFLADGQSDLLIQSGASVNLAWNITNFNSLFINGVVQSNSSSSLVVSPSQTTTYTLRAVRSNTIGFGMNEFSEEKTVRVQVNHAPVYVSNTTAQPVGQNPNQGVVLSWDAIDVDADSLSSAVDIYEGSSCSGDLIATQTTLNSSVNLSNLNPRTFYSYTVSLSDGRGGVVESGCESFTTGDEGLIGWWNFNAIASETGGQFVSDASGRGHRGRLEGNPSLDAGIQASGLNLDGVNDYVSIADSNDFHTTAMTMEAWIQPSTTSRIQYILNQYLDGSPSDVGFRLMLWENEADMGVFETGTDWIRGISVSDPILGGEWIHLVGVWSGGGTDSSLRIYVNGRLVKVGGGETGDFQEMRNSGEPVRIGVGNNSQIGLNGFFEGLVDEVAIYNRALSVDEVRQSCRRNDPSNLCPDSREPIILTPYPDQILPPTRAYWSWRGEKDRGGNLVHPEMEYEVSFRIDPPGPGGWFGPTSRGISTIGYFVETAPVESSNYELIITATEDGNAFEANRFFSIDDSVLSWWHLDETSGTIFGDAVGVPPNQGTIFNNPLLSQPGILEEAFNFDGSNDYLSIPNTSSLGAIGNETTIQFWMKSRSTSLVEHQQLFQKATSNLPGIGMNLNYPTKTLNFEVLSINNGFMNAGVVSSTDLMDAQWHQVTGTIGSSQIKAYVDGVLEDEVTYPSGSDFRNTHPIFIGSIPGGGRYFNGMLDEYTIYNRSLGEQEICNSYLAFCKNSEANLMCDETCLNL